MQMSQALFLSAYLLLEPLNRAGIGGMHYALQRVAPNAVVLDAFDVNHAANSVYQHNFGKAPQQVGHLIKSAAASVTGAHNH